MKKTLLCVGLFLGSLLTANAQVIFSDNFNDEDVSDWTLIDADGDGNNWADIFEVTDGGTPPISATPISLISRSWQGSPLTPDNWIISPAIVIPAGEGAVNLTWKAQAAAAAWSLEKYAAYVATSAAPADLQASTVKWVGIHEGGPAGTIINKTLDLSSFAGQTVYVAFRHFDCTDQDFLSIDDVTVTRTLSTENFFKSNFAVYPNPATSVLNITSSNNAAINAASITDINGRTVKTVSMNAVSEAQINISDLTAGVYFLNVTSDAGTGTSKIVKK